ncbi:SDR family NAD(P)-dependent oxidoreductase [Vibrio sp. V01_P9A10T6]|uniref:SDR family NAD(P)-dependent oxidoreductase n=1 Tax=Vibrio sp. V01_P9A10T6 TaxID=2116368 RepID=UPI000D037082|nr:SDR family NAD(P)-dependent oxidoreductase [Vibrio sp. V01_P9A10T6]PRQ61617.1 short-chain dehydrogenase [Vibrio sp. V01_P9A10T6]
MKSVLITGATSGIGYQLAVDYAKTGWQVIACGRNQAKLNQMHQEYPQIQGIAFDITDFEQTKSALSQLPFTPSLWILNAGDCEYIDHGQMDSLRFKRVFDVNVLGLAHCIEAIQHHFVANHRVAIVGSIASEIALPRAEAYGASKAAVSYLARSLMQDWREQGVAVTMIYPGFVATPLTDKNSFSMPMMVSAEYASQAIRRGLEKGKTTLYFPARFTSLLRLIGSLPYAWQGKLVAALLK